jgi:ABC-2 type transport system permease protein
VVQVSPDADYPGDLDVLVAAQPSSLTNDQISRLAGYVKSGKPVFVLMDPMTAFNVSLSPALGGGGNIQPLLTALGVEWRPDRIAWDKYNPHPQLSALQPEIVFVGRGNQGKMPFQEAEAITAGLQEVVLLYPGSLGKRSDSGAEFIPLLTTGRDAGQKRFQEIVQQSLFGITLAQGGTHEPDGEERTLAAKISGNVNAVAAADVDLMGEEFFDLRRRGVENLNLDNVTFVLNAIDDLAGEDAFIALRKRRPKHRTLELVERRAQVYEEERLRQSQAAAALAEQRLQEAQARVDAAVAAIRSRADLDEQTRQIMISNVETTENRRLQAARTNIEEERERQIEDARAGMESSIRGIQSAIKLLAVSLPPVPAFLMFLLVSARKLKRERMRIAPERLIARRAEPPLDDTESVGARDGGEGGAGA